MPPDANLLLHEVTGVRRNALLPVSMKDLFHVAAVLRREGEQEREVVTKEQERPGQAGSCTPVRSWGFVLTGRSQSGKGFMQGRDTIQK